MSARLGGQKRALLLGLAVVGGELLRLAISPGADAVLKDPLSVAPGLLVTGAILGWTVAWAAHAGRWSNVSLGLALYMSYTAVRVLLVAAETAFFAPTINGTSEELPRLVVAGLAGAVPPVWVGVRVYADDGTEPEMARVRAAIRRPGRIAAALMASGVLYVALFFAFGLATFAIEPVRAFYAGVEPALLSLLAVEFGRGVGLGVVVLLLAVATRGEAQPQALLCGAFLAATNATLLVYPTPPLPDLVRLVHVLEIAAANFLFGVLSCRLLRPRIP